MPKDQWKKARDKARGRRALHDYVHGEGRLDLVALTDLTADSKERKKRVHRTPLRASAPCAEKLRKLGNHARMYVNTLARFKRILSAHRDLQSSEARCRWFDAFSPKIFELKVLHARASQIIDEITDWAAAPSGSGSGAGDSLSASRCFAPQRRLPTEGRQ